MLNYLFTAFLAATSTPSAIDPDVRNGISYALIILMTLLSIAIIVLVMMQKSGGEDVTAITGGTKNDSFFGKNKADSREGLLRKATVVCGVLMLVVSVVYFVILSI